MDKYQELLLYKKVMEEDVELTYGKVSIHDLRHYNSLKFVGPKHYQVHCDDPNLKFSEVFVELDKALMKFIEIKHKLKNTTIRKKNYRAPTKSTD